MIPKAKVKTYDQRKKEREGEKQKREENIQNVLNSAQNNPKFMRLLSYSLNSIDNLITPPNQDIRLNAKIIIQKGGIEILKNVALKNEGNEEVINHLTDIIWKLTSLYDNVDNELAQNFVDGNGHKAVMDLLLKKQKGPSSLPLFKTLNGLVKVPHLVNCMLASGLIDTMKQVNDLYTDDLAVIDMNFDTLQKISNQKIGREYIHKKGMCPKILQNVKICSDNCDTNGVATGLDIINNVCRNDEGKIVMKNSNAGTIVCEVVDNFNGSDVIINKAAKIFSKIFTKSDFDKEMLNFKNAQKKFELDPSLNNLAEFKKPLGLLANMALVEDLAQLLSKKENFDELVKLFNKLCDIDLNGKPPAYVNEYMNAMKHFMNAFKRVFDQSPDCLDVKTKRGAECKDLIKKINGCIKKNWENAKLNVENLEKGDDPNGDAEKIKGAFRGYFTAYAEILNQNNEVKSDNEKKDPEWVNILDYVVGDVIAHSTEYLGDDERPNYSASKILKIADNNVNKYPGNCGKLETELKDNVPYVKGVVHFSNNFKTLNNDLDVMQHVLKKAAPDTSKQIMPTIADFMIEKPRFRGPNLTSLNILDDFLTPNMVKDYQMNIKNPKGNALGVDYVDAIDSVMANQSINIGNNLDESFDDLHGDAGELEPKNDETEKKIIEKGSELLKKLIPMQEFLKEVKDFKGLSASFNPDGAKDDMKKKLHRALVYQNCALNVKEFFNAGNNDDFAAVRDLIRKEINYIEGFKRIKANESNPQFQEIVSSSRKRLKLALGTLRKLEDQAKDNYSKYKDEKCKNLYKDIMELNNEIYDKSTDSPNLVDHLIQLHKNVPFVREKEKEIGNNKNGKPISENCVNSLLNLFRKAIGDDDLSDQVIKNLIAFAENKKDVCNNLVRSGCPRLLMQVLDNTQNRQVANDAVELLNMLTCSSPENANVIGNQNILVKLFEVRSKFAYCDEITKKLDHIANEIMKSPDQWKFGQELLKEAVQEFHDNVRKNFKDNEIKQKILNNAEVISSITSNKRAMEPILTQQFIDDLSQAIDLTAKSTEASQTIDKLLTNELALVKKLKNNLPSKSDPKHEKLLDDAIKILLEKPNYIDPLIVSCKCVSDYLIDDELYNKHAYKKMTESFIDKLFAIQEDNLDHPEVTKEINNLLCHLALRHPKYADCIVKNGGLVNVINELKAAANLNDPASKLLKLNGLKMLNSLLKDDKNLDKFIKANGVDLINKLVKNEVNQVPNDNKDLPNREFLTDCTICTKTPEQIKTDDKLGRFPFPDLAKNSDDVAEKTKQIMSDLMTDDKNSSIKDISDTSDNYCVQCLKIINKGLDKGKKEFVDDKIVSNLTSLAQVNFPDKYLFNEVASILSNKNVNIPNDPKTNENLLKLGLSNKALFYPDDNVKKKVQDLENKIAAMLNGDKNYKNKFVSLLADKKLSIPEKNKLLTFVSLLADKPEPVKQILDEAKPNLCNFFNDMLNAHKPTIQKILNAKKSGPKEPFNLNSLKDNEKYDEGVVLSLGKLYNHLLEMGLIKTNDPKNKEYIESLNALADPLYRPDNYIFVNEFEKEMDKVHDKIGKYENGKKPNENDEEVFPTKTYLSHLDELFPKTAAFLDDFHREMQKAPPGQYPDMSPKKEDNLNKILTAAEDYFKSNAGDPKLKADECKKLREPFLVLFDDFQKHCDANNNNKTPNDNSKQKLEEKMNKIWGLMGEAIKNDKNNNIVDPNEPTKVRDLINRINNMIKNFGNDDKGKYRFIPLNVSRKCNDDEDVNNALIDFVHQDVKRKKTDIPEIKFIDLEILSNVSKHPGSMKAILKNDDLWKLITSEGANPNLSIKHRGIVASLIKNATASNYDTQNIIKRDPKFLKEFIKKVLKNPVKDLGKDGKEVAQKELETLCNILKDENNVRALNQEGLLNEKDLKDLIALYDRVDPKLTSSLKPLVKNLEDLNNKQKAQASIDDDYNLLNDIAKRVNKAFDAHKTNLSKLPDTSKNIPDVDESKMSDIEKLSSLNRKRLSFITGTLLFNTSNLEVQSPLETSQNQEMDQDLDKILNILRKNYADLKSTKGKDANLDKKKMDNVNLCLNLLKKIALAPENHKPILDKGFMNYMENLNDDYHLLNKDGNPNTGAWQCPIMVGSKDVLQACSNSEDAIPFIRDSQVLMDVIEELDKLYDKPNLVKGDDKVAKCFLADNVIFSNVCKDKKGLEVIMNKLGLEKLLSLAKKTANSNLLDGILSLLIKYVKNAQDKDKIPNNIIDGIFNILDKCINLKGGKTPKLMSKCLILGGLLYNTKHGPKVDNIDLVKNMNNDLDLFKDDGPYINTCLNTLNILANKPNIKKAVDIGLLKKLNDQVWKVKDVPANKGTHRQTIPPDPNANLKAIYNLTRLYNKLSDVDPTNVCKFNNMGITTNAVKFMNQFNDKVEPLTDEEKKIHQDKIANIPQKKEEEGDYQDDNDDVDTKNRNELLHGIMGNSMNTMKKVTADKNNNEFVANQTPFGDTILKTLGNPKNDKGLISSGLRALDGYLRSEKGKNYGGLDLNGLYNLLKNLQTNNYSDPNLLKSINSISSSLVNNLKDNDKAYVRKFYDLINDSTKLQDWNPDLVEPALKQMYDGLTKKPFLVDQVPEETIPNVMNLLKVYKDNPDIQDECYKILDMFSKNAAFSQAMMNSGLIGSVKETLANQSLNDNLVKSGGHPVKGTIYKLLNHLSGDQNNAQIISDGLMNPLLQEVEKKGYTNETMGIITLLDKLLLNNKSVQPFVQYNGIDSSLKLLDKNKNTDNVECDLQLFQILKKVAGASDEYKQIMQEKKTPDLVNTIIDKKAPKDKNVEIQGRALIFLVNSCKMKLEDPNSIGLGNIKIEDPIPPEVRNYLTNGKQVKIINNNGDVKQMQLIFNNDLKKVMGKKIKSNLPPKPKYIIDTPTIKKIVKGYGTDAFKKSGGLFHKAPKPNVCFSIIGPTDVEGTKALNVVCDDEKEVDKWISYIEIVINYFRRNKTIKGAVVIKKTL